MSSNRWMTNRIYTRLAQMQMKVFRPIDERDVIMRLHLSLCATTTTKRLSREAAQRTRRLHSCELENSQIGDNC